MSIQTLGQRFWGSPWKPKVDFTGSPIGCWVWLGMKDPGGRGQFPYGIFKIKNHRYKAHRVAWELAKGPIPKGLCVLHKCDNPPCVNPDHLFLGTKGDNFADARAKGRLIALRGEEASMAKLTWKQVREIREKHASGGHSWNSL